MKATSASTKKTTVLPMTKSACKYTNPSGTPKNATARVRITRFTRAAITIVSGPTQTSLRNATPFREVERVVVDAISFSFQRLANFYIIIRRLSIWPQEEPRSRPGERGYQHNDKSGKIRSHLHE